MVRDGALGEPRYVTGAYHQDWLLSETDWNWRLVAERQGQLQAVADIGSHWLDLVSFVSGRRVVEVLADLHTFVPERNHPLEEVGTFAGHAVAADVERVREPMTSDDAAGMLLRFEGGMRGVCSVSQVSAGRKNRLTWELSCSERSLAWVSEEPEYLWVGHRDRRTRRPPGPGADDGLGAAVTGYPAGHVEGYPDTFRGLFAAVYADVAAGRPSAEPYPTFADGHDVARLRRRCRVSQVPDLGASQEERTMKLGLLTAAFPDTPLTEVADWAAASSFSALEVACWPRGDGAARRYAACPTSTWPACPTARPRGWWRTWPAAASRSAGSASTPTRCTPTPPSADALAHAAS